MIVGYVDPSADAAIAGTYKDLKFTNNTDAPIYIEGYTQDMVLYFNVFGQETRPSDREVIFESETLSTTDPGVQYQASGGHPIGYISQKQSSHVGYTAQLWKIVKVGGVEQSREVFNKSTYKASPRIVVVGTASANPEAVAAMNAAVASQNQGAIEAAAAQWNDAAQQAAAQQAAEQAAQQQQQQQQQELQQQPGDEEPKDDKPQKEDDDDKGDKGNKGDKNDDDDSEE